MIQYTLKIGRTVLDDQRYICKSLKSAEHMKKEFESANKAYDIPNPESISIVSREVTSWKKENTNGR